MLVLLSLYAFPRCSVLAINIQQLIQIVSNSTYKDKKLFFLYSKLKLVFKGVSGTIHVLPKN